MIFPDPDPEGCDQGSHGLFDRGPVFEFLLERINCGRGTRGGELTDLKIRTLKQCAVIFLQKLIRGGAVAEDGMDLRILFQQTGNIIGDRFPDIGIQTACIWIACRFEFT